jgi:hypothetical protein
MAGTVIHVAGYGTGQREAGAPSKLIKRKLARGTWRAPFELLTEVGAKPTFATLRRLSAPAGELL